MRKIKTPAVGSCYVDFEVEGIPFDANGISANVKLVGDDTVLPKLRYVAAEAQTIYLGGCFKLKRLQSAFGEIAGITAESGTMLVVGHGRIQPDASADMLSAVKDLMMRARYYLPSREEFCTLWGVEVIEAGLAMLYSRAPHLTVIVKDGLNSAYFRLNNMAQHVPALPVANVRSLSGAGDSFNVGFIAAIIHDLPIERAVAYACSVAAAKISGQHVPKLST